MKILDLRNYVENNVNFYTITTPIYLTVYLRMN